MNRAFAKDRRDTPARFALLLEYVRFGITGALNTATDFLVLNILLSVAGSAESVQGWTYVLAKAASFTVAVIQSYFLNKHWVFGVHTTTRNMEESARFFAVSVAGFVLNIASAALVFGALGALGTMDVRLRANIGALVGTLIVLAWNYTGYKFFVFKTSKINNR
ncbi:MAG: GtrA family protein [Patescibacteria group bacterium]|nr:GtrA family protein [Patescibacteria group bacterium]MDE2116291.1 GtrA family protein [Patescibacteria group bacterium]